VANYSSSGESEEDEAAVAPTVKSCASASKSGEAVVSERLRKRRAPKRSGPSLAEKRRALMGAPVAIPHSDDEDDPGPTAALPVQSLRFCCIQTHITQILSSTALHTSARH
jgi:hypothetical protein